LKPVASKDLPDDPARWPTNPHELLGLGHDADARSARRAYLSLVRRFKPEHSPEQFKRIREAYEYIEQQIKSRGAHGHSWDDEESENDDEWNLGPAPIEDDDAPPFTAELASSQEAPAAPAPRGVPLFAADPERQCQEVWRDLCAGADPPDVFARLLKIREQPGAAAEACLRLYWLTVAAPEVDPTRGPCHWLTEGLRSGRMEGRLRELYRRELEANPHEAATERCGALLHLDAPLGAIADLAEWRWRALGRIGRCDLLLADMPGLRQRIVFDEEETWGRLLVTAIDQLAWSPLPGADQAAAACRQELDQLSHLHGALEREFDRLDLLSDVVFGWRRISAARNVPRNWCELIPLSWTRDYARIRPQLLPVLKDIVHNPFHALGVMDEMARCGAAAVAQLGFTIEAYRYAEERYEHDRRSDADLAALVGKFIRSHDCSNYRAARAAVLQFCLVEAIEPLAFAQSADELTRHLAGNGSWQDLVADDGPLRYVYSAVRAFS
jgi:hypothetical protein